MKRLFFLIILVMPLALAAVENYNNNSEITVKIDMTIESFLTYTSDSSDVDEVILTSLFFPKNINFQEILSMDTTSNPSAEIEKTEDKIICKWSNPLENLTFNLNALIKSKNDFVKIKDKINFPPPSFSNNLKKYTESSNSIDINNEIKIKANELVEGETDYLMAITRIADFTKKYVNYELNLQTEEGVKPASWVYANKEGACDEISALFMAFLRSLGIPVRFVSGVAYSNIHHAFGNHGWTEVYYPKYGWMPFDVTYGQYGWIDPSHIVFLYTVDPTDSSIDYSWKSTGVKLNTKPLKLNSSVVSTKGTMPSLLDIEIKPWKENVKMGSYMVVQAIVKNNNNFYFPFSGHLSKAPGLTDNKTLRQFIIPPGEKRNFYWIIKSPENLDKNYVYTSNIELTTNFGNQFKTKINYADFHDYYNYDWAKTKLEKLQEREEKFSFKNLELDCITDKDLYYLEEQAQIKCFLKNRGNVMIKDLSVCLGDDCMTIILSINELRELQLPHNVLKQETIKIVAEDKDMVEQTYLNIRLIPVPEVYISDINPQTTEYKNNKFNVLVSTDIPIYNATLNINDLYKQYLNSLQETQNIPVTLESKNFLFEPMFINLTYHDQYGKMYNKYSTQEIEITNIPWYIKLKIYFLSLFNNP